MPKKVTIMVFSGDFEKTYAAFNIANGAASMGMDVTMFFTFHGLNLLKKGTIQKLSNSEMGKMMSAKNLVPLEKQFEDAKELGIKFIACETTMDAMGVKKDDLIEEVSEIAAVGTYVYNAKNSQINLFI